MWHCRSLFGLSARWGFHPWGGVFQLLFWAALIIFIIWVIMRITPQTTRPTTSGADGAIATLDHRLARGEISIEEYHQTKQVLSKG